MKKSLGSSLKKAGVTTLPQKKKLEVELPLKFWERIQVKSVNECWLWTGMKRGGYGRFNFEGRVVTVHRFLYSLYIEEVADNLCVMHKCDVRNCVNLRHLTLGTYADNTRDMDNKGRRGTTTGESNGRSILTEKEVREIKVRYTPRCKVNGRWALAIEFEVSDRCIKHIVEGDTWKHV